MNKPVLIPLILLASLVPAGWAAPEKPESGKSATAIKLPLKGFVSLTRAQKNKLRLTARTRLQGCPVYKEAIGYFNQKNYAKALQTFEFLDTNGFCCDLIHYYIAQCYQNTNQLQVAMRHYDWVASNSKDAQLRQYSDYANQTMAYYGAHRTYSGQGNYFDPGSRGGGGGGGGGGRGGGFG